MPEPPRRGESLDDTQVIDRRRDPVRVVQEQGLAEFERDTVLLSGSGEKVLRIPVGDLVVLRQSAGITNESSFRIVERYCHPAFQHSAIAETEAEMTDRLISEAPFFQIRVIWIERLQLEIDRFINDDALPVAGIESFQKENLSDLECGFPQFVRMVGVESFHTGAEIEDISLGVASEALPYSTIQVDRERRRPSLSLVRGQWAVAGRPFTLHV